LPINQDSGSGTRDSHTELLGLERSVRL
jgi:hypothetical protein